MIAFVNRKESIAAQAGLKCEDVVTYIEVGVTSDRREMLIIKTASWRGQMLSMIDLIDGDRLAGERGKKGNTVQGAGKSCFKGHLSGPFVHNCSKGGGAEPRRGKLWCYRCNPLGHKKSECPQRSSGRAAQGISAQSAKGEPMVLAVTGSGNRSGFTANIDGLQVKCQLDRRS